MFVDQNLDQIYVHENLDSGKLSKKKKRKKDGTGKEGAKEKHNGERKAGMMEGKKRELRRKMKNEMETESKKSERMLSLIHI